MVSLSPLVLVLHEDLDLLAETWPPDTGRFLHDGQLVDLDPSRHRCHPRTRAIATAGFAIGSTSHATASGGRTRASISRTFAAPRGFSM